MRKIDYLNVLLSLFAICLAALTFHRQFIYVDKSLHANLVDSDFIQVFDGHFDLVVAITNPGNQPALVVGGYSWFSHELSDGKMGKVSPTGVKIQPELNPFPILVSPGEIKTIEFAGQISTVELFRTSNNKFDRDGSTVARRTLGIDLVSMDSDNRKYQATVAEIEIMFSRNFVHELDVDPKVVNLFDYEIDW